MNAVRQILFFVLCIVPSFLYASTADFPRLQADPRIVSAGGAFNISDWHSLFLAAFTLSGTADGTAAMNAFSPVVDQLSASVTTMDDRTKAETVLEFMHDHFLRRYELYQTRFDLLLASGGYNCVSSAVLYTILGTAVGLDVTGVQTTDHAFCSVETAAGSVDVETTNRYGFDPGSKKEFHDNFGKTTGFAYVPPGNYRDRTEVSTKQLFSLILSNRITESEQAGQYAAAVGLSVDMESFLGKKNIAESSTAVREILNYGTQLVKTEKEKEALSWSDTVASEFGPYPGQVSFESYAAGTLITRLLRKGDTADARSALEENQSRLDTDTASKLTVAVADAVLVDAFSTAKQTGNEAEFLQTIQAARDRGILSEQRIRDTEIAWYLYRIDFVSRTEGWAAAYSLAGKIIESTGSDSRLEKVRSVCRRNVIADQYNAAAAAFNNGQYEKAKSIAEAAASDFPDEPVFTSLLTQIGRALQQ